MPLRAHQPVAAQASAPMEARAMGNGPLPPSIPRIATAAAQVTPLVSCPQGTWAVQAILCVWTAPLAGRIVCGRWIALTATTARPMELASNACRSRPCQFARRIKSASRACAWDLASSVTKTTIVHGTWPCVSTRSVPVVTMSQRTGMRANATRTQSMAPFKARLSVERGPTPSQIIRVGVVH